MRNSCETSKPFFLIDSVKLQANSEHSRTAFTRRSASGARALAVHVHFFTSRSALTRQVKTDDPSQGDVIIAYVISHSNTSSLFILNICSVMGPTALERIV